jgi:aryl-alcohol dehydrogenase-like predicted oxidoreductase
MRYRLFGRSGLRISEVCLGTMTFGDAWGADWGAAKGESEQILRAFLDAGGNFIDTANGYTNGQSEEWLGQWIPPLREKIVLATKYSFNTSPGDPNAGGNHRKNLVQALNASLRRLRTDYIDIFWVHVWDFTTPVDELLRALDDLVRAGKILHVGVSNTPAWIVSQANAIAHLRGWTPFVGLQIEYNLLERTVERDLIPMARAFGIGITAWSPLAGGVLTGKYRNRSGAAPTSVRAQLASRRLTQRTEEIVRAVSEIAEAHETGPAQIALAWVAGRGHDITPILGARTLQQFRQNLGFLTVRLTAEETDRLKQVSAIEMGFPHQFLDDVRNGRMPGGIWGVPVERVQLGDPVVV